MEEETEKKELPREEVDEEKERTVTESETENPTDEQMKIEEEDTFSLSEVLDYDKEEDIEINEETMESIKNHWKKRYKEDPGLRNSLEQAYYKMGEWVPYLKEQFRKNEIPEKYLYLAIPESHWQMKAVSSRSAVGPYQFTPATARSYGLKTSYFAEHPSNLEERSDPIKSAHACADLLKDLYNTGGDWDLALSGYNGSFFWRYLKYTRNNKEKVSYQGFLRYLEGKINGIKKEIRSDSFHEHIVSKGESMSSISRKYGLTIDIICKTNGIDDKSKIYIGQSIKIPISEYNQRSLFESKVRGMAENLNYPAKFNAVYELIEEGFVEDSKSPINFKIKKIDGQDQKYIFKKEDGSIYRLSLKFQGISDKDILKSNPHIDPANLKGGEELTMPNSNSEPTLKAIAEKDNINLEYLKKLNPAVKDPSKPIPKGYKIRI
ncbi:MAG: LysM peptidoglycan-binding domain-containing protein [Patescibacteria group bacterium]